MRRAGDNAFCFGLWNPLGYALLHIVSKAERPCARMSLWSINCSPHFLMGVALGLSLVLLLGLIEAFHLRELIAHSEAPI